MSLWMITGERQSCRFRKEYFRALLRQEIAWFDMVNPNELNSKVNNDTAAIESGISDKFFSFFRTIALVISGLEKKLY